MAQLVYVDDLVLIGNDSVLCARFKTCVHSCFRIKDSRPLKYFLSIEVARDAKAIFLCQRKYAPEIVEECGLLGAKPIEFPMEMNHKLSLATRTFLQDPT